MWITYRTSMKYYICFFFPSVFFKQKPISKRGGELPASSDDILLEFQDVLRACASRPLPYSQVMSLVKHSIQHISSVTYKKRN